MNLPLFRTWSKMNKKKYPHLWKSVNSIAISIRYLLRMEERLSISGDFFFQASICQISSLHSSRPHHLKKIRVQPFILRFRPRHRASDNQHFRFRFRVGVGNFRDRFCDQQSVPRFSRDDKKMCVLVFTKITGNLNYEIDILMKFTYTYVCNAIKERVN